MEFLALTDAELGAWLGGFLWPLFRILGFLMVAPVLGSNLVPMRVRLVLAVVLAFVAAPLAGDVPAVDGLSLSAMLIVLQQVLVGAALGFFLQIIFQLFTLASQMIAMQMGLGFASMMDPANGVTGAILSTFYVMFVTLLFVTMDGHLLMIAILIDSFQALPVGTQGLSDGMILQLVSTISWAFGSALVLALPAVTALLLTNFAFGIMTRAAPQMNIFALGFPVALMFGLFILWVLVSVAQESLSAIFNEAFLMMRALFLE